MRPPSTRSSSLYKALVRWGNESVRTSWRFGQCLDSFTDTYTRVQLADAMGLSVGTIRRYIRLYEAYQRPELALEASRKLETFNIDIITDLANQLSPVEHARPYAGRKFRYRCHTCHGTEVKREEYDPDTGATITPADDALAVTS